MTPYKEALAEYEKLNNYEVNLLNFWKQLDNSFNYTDPIKTARQTTRKIW